MPREVYLEPSGSPFVHSTPFNPSMADLSTESSLTDLSAHYFQDNDNLNSSNGLAGLADVTIGMGDDTSVMRLQTSESDELLMGVKGEEFLADDSMMDTPFLSRSTRSRSKLSQSTTLPPPVSEVAEAEVEEPAKVEKPKRKKSTRSRSSSPSKKSLTTEPALGDATALPQPRMEIMTEEPEPEPEHEPKLRRSPRKTRTRLPSTAEPPSAFPTVSSGVSPFASSPTPPAPEPTLPDGPVTSPEPEPSTEPQTARKTKRASRVVGRSKSKSRTKSMHAEEPMEEDPKPVQTEEEATALRSERPSPETQQVTSPSITAPSTSIETHVQESASELAQVEGRVSPTPPPAPPSPTTTHDVELKPYHVRTEPGPAPFKFQLPHSIARNKTQTAAPVFGESRTPTPTSMPFNPTTVGPDTPKDNSIPPQTEQGPTGPSKEEEAEAVAAAMRILRRDSSVFGHALQPYSSALGEPLRSDTPQGVPSPAIPDIPEEPVIEQADNASTPAEAVPPKRTRVGRKSTRARGNARVSSIGRAAGKSEVGVQDLSEQEPYNTAVASPTAVPGPRVETTPNSNEDSNGNARLRASEDVRDVIEEEQHDIAIPVNFGSRSPSPTPAAVEPSALPALPQAEDVNQVPGTQALANPGTSSNESQNTPTPEPQGMPSKELKISPPLATTRDMPVKKRTTRASMPAQTSHISLPARTTRATRRSEVRPTISRGDSGAEVSKPKEPLIEEQDVSGEAEKPAEDTAPTEVSISTRSGPLAEPIASTTPLDSPVVPAPGPVSGEIPEEGTQVNTDQPGDVQEPAEEPAVESTGPKAIAQPKSLGLSTKRGPQRAVSGAPQRTASNTSQRSASGSSQPRRVVSSAAQKPTQSTRTASATRKPASASKLNASTDDATTSSTPTATPPQRTTVPSSQKPSSSSSNKPPSTSSAPSKSTSSTGVTISKADVTPPVAVVPSQAVIETSPPETRPRAVRALPKRATRLSKEAKVATIPEDSMEVSSADLGVIPEMEADRNDEAVVAEQIMSDVPPTETAATSSIWPREPAANPFAPAKPFVEPEIRTSPRSGKRRASSPDPEPETDANDSPSKRVRFSSVLEAGPTPGIGRVLQMPKPSLKVKKPKFERKPNRPKRVLTRDWVVGDVPSYAAPLKRDVREREEAAGPAEKPRPPLSETQTNARIANDKMKPTVPVAFTFRSELRLKPRVEEPLPAGIPIATPMPDFSAAHAAAEAANLARRERAQKAFLDAQAELEACRHSKYVIGSETARRAAERAVFDAAMKVKEAEAERVHVEQSKLEAEKEAMEIKEMRRRMVPKANPVPEFYRHIARNDTGDIEA